MFRLTNLFLALCLLVGCSNEPKTPDRFLHIAANAGPHALDPRSGRILVDATVLNMLYEGLMRLTPSGDITPGIAESVSVSDDRQTYTFHLREAYWSNGDPVTAEDFVYSWKSQLDPSFAAPNAFMLYVIKNARAAKAGSIPSDAIGILAADPHTLIVQLETPTPYFLDLTAFYALFPVNSRSISSYNGPFRLLSFSPNSELNAIKNERYWDRNAVSLEGINIAILDEHTALSLFEEGSIDWTGSPLSTLPGDALPTLAKSGQLESTPAAATQWLRFNVEQVPLNVRRALTLAVNRRDLVDHVIQGSPTPAMGIVPKSPRWPAPSHFADHDVKAAKQLITEKPQTLTLTYGPSERDRRLAQALQQQWHQSLGIWVELQSLETKLLYERLKSRDYLIANGSWFADFDDPINFLAVFESQSNGTNNTGWENPHYQKLLAQSSLAADPSQRLALLQEAERLLIAEAPVAPIFFFSLNYVKSSRVRGVGVTPLGIQIFREGYLTE